MNWVSMLKSGGIEHQFRLFKTTGTLAFDPHTIKRIISMSTGSTITVTDFSL